MSKFLINCFIRKNTEGIRRKLIELGVRHNDFDDNSGQWLASNYGMFISVNPGFENLHPDDIDCGIDADLFLGLASITDETKDIDIKSLKDNLTGNKSLCWKCMYSCDVTNSLKNKGYCGCTFLLTKGLTFLDEEESYNLLNGKINAHELGSGWIYNRRSPYGLGIDTMSGMMTNDSLIVKECTKCSYFRNKDE